MGKIYPRRLRSSRPDAPRLSLSTYRAIPYITADHRQAIKKPQHRHRDTSNEY